MAGAVVVAVAAGAGYALGLDDPKPATSPAAAAGSAAPASFTVNGRLRLELSGFTWNPGQGCWGISGYDDLREGAQVVITDGLGATIAVGALDTGIVTLNPTDQKRASYCELPFTVQQVPAGRGFYGVEVAHRGRVQYPEADVRGLLELSLN